MRIFAWNTPRTLAGEEDAALRLRDQIREWERDEQQKMEQERRDRQGARRTLDHLHRGDQTRAAVEQTTETAQTDGEQMETDLERLYRLDQEELQRRRNQAGQDEQNYQTDAQNLGLGLAGRRIVESGRFTNKVVRRFVDEASGQPSDTQVSSELPWS
jgi:hypothetical protein